MGKLAPGLLYDRDMRRPLRILAPLLTLFLSTACIFGPSDPPSPEPLRCDAESAVPFTPDAIDILPSAYEVRPLEDGDSIPLQLGGQGLEMFGVAIEVHGATVPDCALMDVTFSNGFHLDGPFEITHEADRHYVDNLMSIGGYEGPVTISVTVGELTRTVDLTVTSGGTPTTTATVVSLATDATEVEVGAYARLDGTLDVPAPPGGLEVSLFASSAEVEIQEPVVFVPEGASTFSTFVLGLEPGLVGLSATPGDAYAELEVVPAL